MKCKQQYGTGIIALICFMFLIFDSRSVQDGVRQGIELLLHAAIPALFPFMLTASVLNTIMIGKKIPGLKIIGYLCRIPPGAESVFLLGLLAGYPIGAKTIYETYEAGQLDSEDARRLLGFCNNAGPAFIFGILGQMFTRRSAPFVIWGIHILSAMIVGRILPRRSTGSYPIHTATSQRFSSVMEQCIKTMAVISAWIIIWKIVISLCSRYFLLKMPAYLQVIIMGLCELTNGCLALQTIENESVRFIIASCLLACGGLCVTMQTKSVTKTLGTGMYLPGKLLQVLISFIISIGFSYALYPTAIPRVLFFISPIVVIFICTVTFIILRSEKIMVAFR